MTLLEKIKQDMLKAIDDQEIDVTQLQSYEYHEPVYSYSSAYPEDESEEWDENEEFQAKLEYVIDRLESGDTLGDYIDVTEEEDDDEDLKLRLLNWLKGLLD